MSGNQNDPAALDFRFTNIFSLVGIAFLILFGMVRFYQAEPFEGVADILIAGTGLLNLVLLRSTKNVSFASSMMLVAMLALFVFLLFVQGLNDEVLFWFFTFPVLAFFLKGSRGGIVWVGMMYSTILVVGVLEYFGFGTIPYDPSDIPEVGTLFGGLTAVTLLLYFYQIIYEKNAETARVQSEKLKTEIRGREELQKNLANSAAEMSRSNANLEDTKRAMLNLLEDLNIEKANILEQRAKDEAILGSIGDGVFAIDLQRNIILFNPVAETLSGIRAADAVGKRYDTVLKFIFEDTGRQNDEFIRTALGGAKTKMTDHTALVSVSGVRIPVADSAAPVRDDKGNVTGAVVVFRDVTQERQVDRAKTEFVSLASHQLRTPLSAINWYAELLLDGEGGKINKKQKELLRQISSSNSRMIELVNSLLNVSRIDMGTMASSPKPIDIRELIDSVTAELAPSIAAKSLVLKKIYDKNVPRVLDLDPQLMRIIIQNLLSNAVKYTPSKGSVAVNLSLNAKMIEFSVADNGYGIPKNQQDKIFTKLFRADNAKEADPDGNGLGLYLVKSVIEQNGGEVRFDSKEGKGSTFYITIPLSGMKTIEGSKTLSV